MGATDRRLSREAHPSFRPAADAASAAEDPLAGLAMRILAHRNFDRAVLHYVSTALSWRSGHYLLNKISGTHARSMIVGYLMMLHYEAEASGGEDGATYVKILDVINRRRERKDCSPRVLKTVLAILRLAGLVAEERSRSDRRLKFYRPTPKMIAMLQDWYRQTFGCFDVLFETDRFAARTRSDPLALRHVILSVGRPYVELDLQVVGHDPHIYDLFTTEGGFIVASALVDAHLRGTPTDSARAISAKYGSSPSQVRQVLKDLSRRGLIDVDETGRPLSQEGLVARYRAHVAREMALYARYALGLDEQLRPA